ncbi:MAG TPA: DNA primase [Planctomycetaceae bacterium]|nr:DNA primase [Planctomycetaceae bacterium]
MQPCCRLVPENAEFVWYWCDLFGDQCAAGVCEVQGTGDDFRELVRSSTNLVDLVAETVTLKPLHGGRQYVGLCPFHDDHNPSFYVYPDRQSYRCWVCQQGGDCFRWVMEIEKLSFPEAMESLARRARLEIPKRGRGGAGADVPGKAAALEIVEWAANLMHEALRTGRMAEHAREYVEKRRLTAETVRNFRLGYHPEDRYWLMDRARGKYTPAQLVSAGLLRERDEGQGYSAMDLADRLIFPIFDERSRIVAFGGRVLPGRNDQNRGKYWNSQESGIFQKRRTMYAFDRARETIRRQEFVIIVEGYMDCIACHQAGVLNAVATLGTALTEEHVRFLRRFASRVVLVYDSDDAGQRAAERSISQFIAQDLDLRILNVPSGKDPADYLEDHSREEFLSLTASAAEAWEYKLQAVLKRTGVATLAGRQQVLGAMLEFLAGSQGLAGTVREDMILRSVCWRVQVDERVARQQLGELRGTAQKKLVLRRSDEMPEAVPARPENALDRAERELLEILLTCPDMIEIVGRNLGPDDFRNPQHQKLLELCLDLWKEEGELPELGRLISRADSDSAMLNLINSIVDSAEDKGIFRLMSDGGEGRLAGAIPVHLERVLGPLLEKRDRPAGQLSRQMQAQTGPAGGTLDENARAALKKLTEFRRNQTGNSGTFK